MRVGQTQRSNATAAGRGVRRASGPGGAFQPSLATAPRKAAGRGMAAVSSLDVIVALQAVEDPAERRKRAIRDAGETLDVLDELKIGVLSGTLSPSRIARLKALLQRPGEAGAEPELEDILRQIDLRARVELAKLERDTR